MFRIASKILFHAHSRSKFGHSLRFLLFNAYLVFNRWKSQFSLKVSTKQNVLYEESSLYDEACQCLEWVPEVSIAKSVQILQRCLHH